MSQYKSALRSQQPPESIDNSKYRQQARQLQELFPTWSNDDLQSLLVEVQGDVELAATRISDGVAEQWGSVSRKKDKKPPASAHASKESFPARGDVRGARGGRGGRGGPGRGGAAVRGRGGPRGGAVNGRSPRVGSPNQAHPDGTPAVSTEIKDVADSVDASPLAIAPEGTNQQNGVVPPTGRTDASSSHLTTPALSTSSSWAGASTTSTWGGDTEPNGSSASVNVPSSKLVSKPATSKLSWAQIARPQEKVTPPPPAPPVSSHPVPLQAPSNVLPPPVSEPEPESQTQSWQEPTTAQAPPTWDDEPQAKPTTSGTGAWISTPGVEEPKTEQPEPQTPQQHEAEVEATKEPVSAEPEKQQPLPASKSEPAPLPPLATPVLSQTAAATPSPKLSGRSAAGTHRSSARYKNIDQPVVMPSSFGTGIEKVGMQFGSLSLGGESLLDSNSSEPDAPATAPEPPSPPTPQTQAPAQQDLPPPPPPATAPASTSLGSAIFSQQQVHPQSSQAVPAQPSSALLSIPASIPQPAQQAPAHATVAASPIQQFAQQQHQQAQQQQTQHQLAQHQAQHQAQQHTLTSVHQQQLHQQQHGQQPQHTPQAHNQYAQHGLPTHIDPSQQAQSQQQQSATHSNYFGRGEAAAAAPYFHTPTPPAGQAQDSPYGSFGQLGAQAQHQQGSHLGGFGAQEYGYGDNQRNFYDTYQQGGFGNRNVLGHEDVKGLPGTQQQPPAAAGIPPSSAQAAQPHGSLQAGGQPQPAGAQAPQQGYPVPYPYYTYPQSQQFYSYNPNYAAVPQPFKYPAMYQPPPGPGSAPSPVAKQPGAGVGVGVQPQGNPYSQGLYPQGGYDDYQQHPHLSQHTQQHSHGLSLGQGGVGAGEYGKQLYGGAGQGSMQGFMGLSGQGAGGAGGPTSNAGGPRGAGSPETPYKPYAPKDVGGVAAGRGAGQQQGQVQGQPQGQGQGGQGPQGQGFYGGARFGGGAGGVSGAGGVGGPQQTTHHPQGGPQGHLGYPQGGNDGSFYQYRGQQQGYWQ
ncbi:hypothetical protein D9615_007767 [Tricholomella constricta]|uniref:RNA polymerase II degradation factor 1 n=1 Tax=Tricholomella constricta TaxID=117010 RepID=A0A8H5H3F3_9AGAR|nr:hypothetical protein D9615_007767 [Tricholomella constricta]